MNRVFRENKRLFAFFGFVLMLCTCFMVTTSIMPSVSANETRGNVDYSLAKVSAAAALYLNTMNAPEYHGCDELPDDMSIGNAGGLIGAFDTDSFDKTYSVADLESANVLVYSYAQLGSIRNDKDGNGVGKWKKAQGYGLYGYMLEQIGLDESTVGASGNSFRMIIGVLFMAAYILSIGMNMFFNLVLGFMQAINPFGMFARASAASTAAARGSGNGWVPAFTEGEFGFAGALNDFTTNVGAVYDALYNLSFYLLVPIFLAVAVFMWLLVYKGHQFGKVFKPLFVRLLFIFVGVPFMFSVYDIVLTSAKGTISSSGAPATKVVGALFCDFQAWVYSSKDGGDNIPLPSVSGVTYELADDTYSLKSGTAGNARQICYAVNKQNRPDFFKGTIAGSSTIRGFAQYDADILSDTDKPAYKSVDKDATVSYKGVAEVMDDYESVSGIVDILTRYATGQVVSSADYASAVAKKLVAQNMTNATAMFNTSSSWENYDYDACEAFEYKGNDGAGGAGGTGGTSRNKSVNIKMDRGAVQTCAKERWTSGAPGWYGSAGKIFVNGTLSGSDMSGGDEWGRNRGISWKYNPGGGLSTLSMYNYLNSRFTSSGVHVASPTSTSNDQVKYEHYAVSMVGAGIMRLIYALDALCLLAATSVIGYGYGFSMMMANFRALFQMVPKVITGMIGSLRGIAGALALTFALVAEVAITVILFDVSISILYAIYDMLELPLANLFATKLDKLDTATGGTLVTALLGIISIATILFTIKKLLEWRHAVIGGTVNVSTELINKIIGTQVAAPDVDMPIQSAAGKALTAAGLVYGASAYANGAGLINNNGDGSALTDLTAKFKNGINSGLNNVNAALGVKKGNGTGEQVGNLSDKGYSASTEGLAASDAAQKEAEKASKMNSNGDYRDVKNDYASSIMAEEIAKQNDLPIDEPPMDDEGNPMVGDAATSKTLRDYATDGEPAPDAPNGVYTWKDQEGNVRSVEKTVNEQGDKVTISTNENKDGSWSTSKLVESGDISTLDTSTGSKKGVTDEKVTVEENRRTGDKTVTKLINGEEGQVKIIEKHGHDTAGHATVHSESTNLKTNETTITDTVNYRNGAQDTTTIVSGKGGTTRTDTQLRTVAGGGTVLTSQSVDANGIHTNASTTKNSSGMVIATEETVTDDAMVEIRHTETHVQNTGTKQITTTTTREGSNYTETKSTEYNPNGNGQYMNKTVATTTKGQNTQSTVKVDNYTYDTHNQMFVLNQNNNTYNHTATTASTRNTTSGSSGSGRATAVGPNGRPIASPSSWARRS